MTWSAVWPALAGALAQEVLHWYGLRSRLARPDVARLVRSPGYWLITLAMIGVSGVGTALVYGGPASRPGISFVLGAAFPVLFKKLIAAAITRSPDADHAASEPSLWRRYLAAA